MIGRSHLRFLRAAAVLGALLCLGAVAAPGAESWVIVQRGHTESAAKVRVAVVRIEGDELVLTDAAGRTTRRPSADLRGIVELPPGMDRPVDHTQASAMLAATEKAIELLPADADLKQAAAAWSFELGQLAKGMRKEGGQWVDAAAATEGEYRGLLEKLRTPPHVVAEAYAPEFVDEKVREGEALLSRFPQQGEEIRAAMGPWLGEKLQLGRGMQKVDGQWITAGQAAQDRSDTSAMAADQALASLGRERVPRGVGSRAAAFRTLALPALGCLLLLLAAIAGGATPRPGRSRAEQGCVIAARIGLAGVACVIALAAGASPRPASVAPPDLTKIALLQAELGRAFRGEPPGTAEIEVPEADLNAVLAPWFGGPAPRESRAAAWAWTRGMTVHIAPDRVEARQDVRCFGLTWQITHRYVFAAGAGNWTLTRRDVAVGRVPLGGFAAEALATDFEARMTALLRELRIFDSWGIASVEPGRVLLRRKEPAP